LAEGARTNTNEGETMKPAAKLNELGQRHLARPDRPQADPVGRAEADDRGGRVRGVTANPAIFEKAIVESDEYDDELKTLIERGKSPMEIYETIAVGDLQSAPMSSDPLRQADRARRVRLARGLAPTSRARQPPPRWR